MSCVTMLKVQRFMVTTFAWRENEQSKIKNKLRNRNTPKHLCRLLESYVAHIIRAGRAIEH